MSATPTPSWYDLLDVERTASEAEIRAAWKAAIADLDPGDRRFRLHNQAAEVLLDPERRAAYDAKLAAEDAVHAGEPEDAAEPVVAGDAGTAAEPERAEEPEAADTPAPTAEAQGSGSWVRRPVPAWWLAGAAVLALFMVAVSAFAWTQPHAAPSGPARVLVQSVSGDPEESARAAQSAAERAIGPILSYDYRHLDEDRAAAQSYMTSHYRSKDYDPLFEVVKQNAPGSKAVVKAEVVGSGIVRSGEDRVEVLLFVNRPTTNKKNSEPVVYKDQVRAQMVKVDGEWLVDCLLTSPNGHCD